MNIIYMLLAISVIVALVFFVAFIFSVKEGQYDDTYTPSIRMLFEDELIKEKAPEQEKPQNEHTNNQHQKLK
ncbi:cbb3-type cytochrome oxidase assembly protein CcoS [Gillisia sp. M10.2A]|uniref:Cbb3-type cytochrome oxidase assembly protein CcoS n=1 Tax=Gillisia lutea TaxID=2909668 RepID=A0ABS9EEV9_9FLAO|nr:cbb3-type cytochrome oxidase assembly protein CcoS [Gillisia lutea]MCF4101410.1 cbb3-type cytochrome oxidase assembly protein CcoS [Gillisia lutea]